jgi:2-polyprenyl-6-methoxyphenol hydroxylase-like FAD-dependent oxidoreductase
VIRSPDLSEKAPDSNTDRPEYAASVLVVGAGPTGLLLAAELHRRGVNCHLIDARPRPLDWDRATVIHPRSLELFESLGLVDKFLGAGTKQRGVKIHSRGRVLGTMDLSACGSIYGFNLGLSEEVTESILTDYLHEQGGKVIRSSRLVGLTPYPDGVPAEIERDGARYQIDSRWVVGCDGFHSPTRELSGVSLEGHDIDKPWAVFDATLQGWTGAFDFNFVYLDTLPVILTALPGRRWRVYLRPSSGESDLVAEATLTINQYEAGASFVDVESPTRFQCHAKVATRFRSGRVLLAGDAAHLCSPAEGHGMNCGLQDAVNLAWKLALVCQGAAESALLDSYEAERRPVAETVARSGDVSEQSQTLTEPKDRERRDRALGAMLAQPAARHHEVVAEAELNVDYSGSPIVCGDANSHLAAGQRLPDTITVRPSGGEPCRLHNLTQRAGHTLVLLGGATGQGSELAYVLAALQKIAADSPIFEAAVAFGASNGLPGQIGHLEVGAADELGVERITLLAVRPDGYVGMRSDRDHLGALERYRSLIRAEHVIKPSFSRHTRRENL